MVFQAFQILKKRFRRLDVYALLRIPKEDREISYEEFREKTQAVQMALREMRKSGKIKMAKNARRKDIDSAIQHGLSNLGLYHDVRPLIRDKKGNINSPDMRLLYFYNNRLEGYGLEQYI